MRKLSSRTQNLALERFVEVPLVVHLSETIDDRHSIDLFVVLALHVGAGEEFENGGPELHSVAIG
jgi:hypothetical protein